MVNLYHRLNGPLRPDERFHLQPVKPFCMAHGWSDWLYRRVEWYNLVLPGGTVADGTVGRFNSYVLLWFIRWYRGTVKCDGSRTHAYQAGQLGEPYDSEHYVMTTTPKEMLSVRLRWRKPVREVWANMGGIALA